MELWQALQERRSIRRYKPDPVPRDVLLKLVDAARLAPNNGNSQPWDFVFVTESGLRDKVSAIIRAVHEKYFGQARTDALKGERLEKTVGLYKGMANVPVWLLLCHNQKNNKLGQEYSQSAYLWDIESLGAAMAQLMLAAVEEGLGTCWMGTPGWQEEELKNLLGIPEKVSIIAATPIGYPDETPKARPRDPVESIVHFDRW